MLSNSTIKRFSVCRTLPLDKSTSVKWLPNHALNFYTQWISSSLFSIRNHLPKSDTFIKSCDRSKIIHCRDWILKYSWVSISHTSSSHFYNNINATSSSSTDYSAGGGSAQRRQRRWMTNIHIRIVKISSNTSQQMLIILNFLPTVATLTHNSRLYPIQRQVCRLRMGVEWSGSGWRKKPNHRNMCYNRSIRILLKPPPHPNKSPPAAMCEIWRFWAHIPS